MSPGNSYRVFVAHSMPASGESARTAAARILPDWYLRSRLKMRQIRLLVALDEQRNMHRAASSVAMTQPAATRPVTLVMLEAIRAYFFATGKRIGMKPAGGIRNSKQTLAYLVMVKETLGDDWLTPELFRFGASTLVNDVLMQIAKLVDGNYQGADYFSLP